MKKIFTLLFAICCSFSVIGQTKTGIHLQDKQTNTFFENVPKGLSEDSLTSLILKNKRRIEDKFVNSFLDNINSDNRKNYTIDSIPEMAYVIINGLEFQNKNVLKKIHNSIITNIRKDSTLTFSVAKRDSITGSLVYKDIKRKYQPPYARVTQEHPILAHDFFLFKINTLEPVRYRCSSYSPVLDIFNTEDSITKSSKPRVMVDGRLQAKSFDYDKVNLDDIEKIEVFGSGDAMTYFGYKAQSGLISYITKGSKFCLDWALANTRVVGEIQDIKGNWKPIVDTLFSNIDQFNEYRKKCLKANGAIYIINGKPETEFSNRKSIDMEAITNLKVINSAKTKRVSLSASDKSVHTLTETTTTDNDTIYIETNRNRYQSLPTSNFSKIISELQRLRKSTPDPTPLYFVDNQEIDSEKLKLYKPKELEFVESLEGCDAISKYGKRAEFGVVIYRKKKIE
jgi:hypothetical protein